MVDIAAVISGSRIAIARAASVLENGRPGADALHCALLAQCGRAHVVGITGAPGAGKSTLISALLAALAARGRLVAVLAVDPSSPITGGALLGDRVRMDPGANERVFIRSVSSRGRLGGLSSSAVRLVDLFDAAGFQIVIVETVGTGQSEVEISGVADTSVVVCPPGLGDEVQALKAGILEIADILVVNKSDLPAATRTAHDLQTSPGLRHRSDRAVPVLLASALKGEGIDELVELIDAHARVAGKGHRLALGAGGAPAFASLSRTRLVLGGDARIAPALARVATMAGYEVIVIDPLGSFESVCEKLHGAEVRRAWPEDAVNDVELDARTAVVALSGDARVDDALLAVAARSAAFHVLATPVAEDDWMSPVERAITILAQIIRSREASASKP